LKLHFLYRESSNIKYVLYTTTNEGFGIGVLFICFHKGGGYFYIVPGAFLAKISTTRSLGKFFQKYIKSNFEIPFLKFSESISKKDLSKEWSSDPIFNQVSHIKTKENLAIECLDYAVESSSSVGKPISNFQMSWSLSDK